MIYGTAEFNQLLFDLIKRELRHSNYEKSCKLLDRMKPHIYGDVPHELLSRVRPRESAEVADYRIHNYESTTKSTASKALTIVQKIFNPSFSEIKWNNQSNNGGKLQKYALEYYPKFNSVVKLISETGLKRMVADANGVIAIRPKSVPENELISVEPAIKIYGSPTIWWKDNDCYVIHLKEEQTKQGLMHFFSYYDKNQIVDFKCIVINESVSTEEILIYPINFPTIPVWDLQGDPESDDEGNEYYVSFFEPACSFWNLAITHESDVFAAYISHMHPVKVELAEECDYIMDDQRCNQGTIMFEDGKTRTCPSCGGSGKKRIAGPYGVHLVTHDRLKDSSGSQMKPVEYVTVPHEPTKMLEARAEKMHIKGLEALNMDVIDNVGANQSGIAKVIDRGELYDFLYKISSVIFDTHLTNIFYYFNLFMFGRQDSNPNRNLDSNLPEINKPMKFDISSSSELINEYSIAQKSNVSSEYLRQKMISISAKEFANNPELQKRVIVGLELDPLPGVTVSDIEPLLADGIVSKKDAVIHFQLTKLIDRAFNEFDDFYTLEYQQKVDVLEKYADDFIAANKVTLTPPPTLTIPIDTKASSN